MDVQQEYTSCHARKAIYWVRMSRYVVLVPGGVRVANRTAKHCGALHVLILEHQEVY